MAIIYKSYRNSAYKIDTVSEKQIRISQDGDKYNYVGEANDDYTDPEFEDITEAQFEEVVEDVTAVANEFIGGIPRKPIPTPKPQT